MVAQPYPDRMNHSERDNVSFPLAVERMFLELSQLYERDRGSHLVFPDSMKTDVGRWREMRMRHAKGDYQHTDMEWRSVMAIAQWILDVKAELAGEQPQNLVEIVQAMKEEHESRSRIITDPG